MERLDQQVLNAVQRWSAAGRRFALVTVARTWGSAPRPPGAWLALRDDGAVQGSVSGGCIEDDLIERMRDGRLAAQAPFRLDYGVTKAEAERFGLPCGGSLELVVEPNPDPVLLADLYARIGSGQLVRRVVDLGRGLVSIEDGLPGPTLSWDGQVLATLHGPRWRLLIIGAGQISTYLAQMAQALDYQVSVCDPRIEYSAGWEVAGAPWVPGMPDDAVLAMNPDPRTAIVALTHDPRLDDMALLEALKSPAFYVGALGSHLNNRKRKERLLEYFDLGREEVERLHGPVGLAIGSRTPPEIAVSILAEMTAVKRLGGTPAASAEYRELVVSLAGCGIP
ncbi:XdhC family protein [Zoogloea sp.]|uniref:XdhC family protein n=1 Tax=Zoogloea sp. TaxID=49181 RepID=UPI0014159532|nr:MAG: XdhC family protein [Zoogloea sp.]